MNLKIPNEVTKAALPSLIMRSTQEMFATVEVNGEATELSASDREIPAWAARNAPQSFAPSPHIAATENIDHSLDKLFYFL